MLKLSLGELCFHHFLGKEFYSFDGVFANPLQCQRKKNERRVISMIHSSTGAAVNCGIAALMQTKFPWCKVGSQKVEIMHKKRILARSKMRAEFGQESPPFSLPLTLQQYLSYRRDRGSRGLNRITHDPIIMLMSPNGQYHFKAVQVVQ